MVSDETRPRGYRGRRRRPGIVARLVCAVVGHRWVRVITDIQLQAVSPSGGVGGWIAESRFDCVRCGRSMINLMPKLPAGPGPGADAGIPR